MVLGKNPPRGSTRKPRGGRTGGRGWRRKQPRPETDYLVGQTSWPLTILHGARLTTFVRATAFVF